MGLPMCNGCNGRCCSLRVELTTYDVGQITSAVGQKYGPFIELSRSRNKNLGFMLGNDYYRMTMRKKEGYCIFFNKESKMHCQIYDDRPAICRSYPFSMRNNRITGIKKSGCPRSSGYEWKHDESYPQKIMQTRLEFDRYIQIMNEWNKRARKDDKLEDFLAFAYGSMADDSGEDIGFLNKFLYSLKKVFGLDWHKKAK
jgi:Fe-S-cluster containining protein